MNQNLQLSALPQNRGSFLPGLIQSSLCAAVTVHSSRSPKGNIITVHSGEGEKDQYTGKEIIIYKCTTPAKRDVSEISGRRGRMGHFNFIPMSDSGILQMCFCPGAKLSLEAPEKRMLPLIQRSTKEHETTLVFRAPSSPPQDSFSFFLIPGAVPKRLRVPSQHFLKSISPFSEAELANCGFLLPVGAPGQGKGSPHQ